MTFVKIRCCVTLIFLLSLASCSVKKKQNTQPKILEISKSENIQNIYGSVISIDFTRFNNKILIKDTINERKYILLSRWNDKSPSDNSIKVNRSYNFKVVRLTHVKMGGETLTINGKTVVLSPNLAIEDCIYYNLEKFCSGVNTEIYEAINLNGLDIYEDRAE